MESKKNNPDNKSHSSWTTNHSQYPKKSSWDNNHFENDNQSSDTKKYFPNPSEGEKHFNDFRKSNSNYDPIYPHHDRSRNRGYFGGYRKSLACRGGRGGRGTRKWHNPNYREKYDPDHYRERERQRGHEHEHDRDNVFDRKDDNYDSKKPKTEQTFQPKPNHQDKVIFPPKLAPATFDLTTNPESSEKDSSDKIESKIIADINGSVSDKTDDSKTKSIKKDVSKKTSTSIDVTVDVPKVSSPKKSYKIQRIEIPRSITAGTNLKPMVFLMKKPNYSNDEEENDFTSNEKYNDGSVGSNKSNSSTVDDANKSNKSNSSTVDDEKQSNESNSSTVDDENESSSRFETPIIDRDVSSKESEEKDEVSNADSCK